MQRWASPKLVGSSGLVVSLLLMALITGRLEFIAVAVPTLSAILLSSAASGLPEVTSSTEVGSDRCLEGDVVPVCVSLSASRSVSEVDVAVIVPAGFTPVGPSSIRSPLQGGATKSFDFLLRAERWGMHEVGGVAIRVWNTGRWVRGEQVTPGVSKVKVFPSFERIAKGLFPPEPQIFSGEYVSRSAGAGIEFANVREFRSGDEIKNINWKVTSRRAGLHVNTFHPERNSDVVLFLDTFGDYGEGPAAESLGSAVRGAAGMALHHLKRRDRVGVVSFGGLIRWLPVSMSRRHIYRLLDVLLDAQVKFSFAWKDVRLLPTKTLPPGALVVAFSPLVDRRAISAFQDLQTRGFPLVIIDTLPEGTVTPTPGAEGGLAHRVWKLQRSAVRREFAAKGIPVVAWSEEDLLDSVLAAVPRLPKVGRGVRG